MKNLLCETYWGAFKDQYGVFSALRSSQPADDSGTPATMTVQGGEGCGFCGRSQSHLEIETLIPW